MWESINTTGVSHYTVYYTSTSKRKRETDSGNVTFTANTNQGVIGGLDPNLNYLFAISVTFNIRGTLYEGSSTLLTTPGKIQYQFQNIYLCIDVLTSTVVSSSTAGMRSYDYHMTSNCLM